MNLHTLSEADQGRMAQVFDPKELNAFLDACHVDEKGLRRGSMSNAVASLASALRKQSVLKASQHLKARGFSATDFSKMMGGAWDDLGLALRALAANVLPMSELLEKTEWEPALVAEVLMGRAHQLPQAIEALLSRLPEIKKLVGSRSMALTPECLTKLGESVRNSLQAVTPCVEKPSPGAQQALLDKLNDAWGESALKMLAVGPDQRCINTSAVYPKLVDLERALGIDSVSLGVNELIEFGLSKLCISRIIGRHTSYPGQALRVLIENKDKLVQVCERHGSAPQLSVMLKCSGASLPVFLDFVDGNLERIRNYANELFSMGLGSSRIDRCLRAATLELMNQGSGLPAVSASVTRRSKRMRTEGASLSANPVNIKSASTSAILSKNKAAAAPAEVDGLLEEPSLNAAEPCGSGIDDDLWGHMVRMDQQLWRRFLPREHHGDLVQLNESQINEPRVTKARKIESQHNSGHLEDSELEAYLLEIEQTTGENLISSWSLYEE